MIKEYDVVRLKEAIPELGYPAGTEGTVVMVHSASHVEVEFADSKGVTQHLLTLPVSALEVTWSSDG